MTDTTDLNDIPELPKEIAKALVEKTKPETMTLEEFNAAMQKLNKTGKELTLKHFELYGRTTEDKLKGGRRHHQPGTRAECPHCMPIIKNWENMMQLEAEQIGMSGIPLDGLFSAIKITRATILMMKKGGEL